MTRYYPKSKFVNESKLKTTVRNEITILSN